VPADSIIAGVVSFLLAEFI